jgi:hypothetical protein
MMVLFFHAARLAMVAFDPFMSSRSVAEALQKSPQGTLIVDRHYYSFSSIFFYTNRSALLLHGRFMNLEYGSYAPRAPDVFIDDSQFKDLWLKPERCYIVANQSALPRLQGIVGSAQLNEVATSGGKVLLTNHPWARLSAMHLNSRCASGASGACPAINPESAQLVIESCFRRGVLVRAG